jgi:predicted CopG family antitoxin
MAKSKKTKPKAKLNLTVRDEQRNKLAKMASLEKRSVSNLIEVMPDERWERLA